MGQPPLKGLWPAIATPFADDGGVDADRLAGLGRHLIDSGARGLVLLGTTGRTPPRILLYHYPALAGVGWSFELIAALSESFPEVVVGLKDASDEAHTMNLITAFPELAIFAGSEGHITEALAAGAAGLI